MSEIKELESAIRELEAKRSILGDAVVDTALVPMRARLVELKEHSPGGEQLKYVTVLFVDIAGSTRMGASLDAEDLKDIIGGALGRFRQVVTKHGGFVARYLGDGLMTIFGTPVAREDDPQRAVLAGLEILETTREYAKQIEKTWGIPNFNVRVGISTGQVVLGGELEDDNLAIGMTIHMAQRMESAAPPGGLLITHSTYRHVRGLFVLVQQPPLRVKGRERAVRVYLVRGILKQSQLAIRRGVEGITTPLVGREEEFKRLKTAYQNAIDKATTEMLTVIGDPGVGKSRLLLEFKTWLQHKSKNVLLLEGRATSTMERTPYGLLRDIFTNHLNILDGDNVQLVLQKSKDGLSHYLGNEAQMKVHFIDSLLGFDLRDSPYLAGVQRDAGQLRKRGLFYLMQFFRAAAQEKPIVLLLDDLHWSDASSLNFITSLCQETNLQLFILCFARPQLIESRQEWNAIQCANSSQQSRMYLYPLSTEASDRLLETILRESESIPTELRQIIHKNTDGNPFYIEEIINSMIDEGVIQRRQTDGTWIILTDRLLDLQIPPTLTALLQSRLDSLPEDERETLQAASIIGRIFWDETLQVLLRLSEAPDDALTSLSDRDIIYPRAVSTFVDTDEYIFKHILMRDVTYESILKRHKRELHGRVADWLECSTREVGREDEYAAIIAQHWENAENNHAAANWYLRAARKTRKQDAPEEAKEFLDRALQLTPASDEMLKWSILLERCEIVGMIGDYEQRLKDEQALLELATSWGDDKYLAEVYYRQGSSLARRGDDRHALEFFEKALETARRARDQHLETLLLALTVVSYTRLGEMEKAETNAEQALQKAYQLEDDETLARALTNASIYYSETGDIARAIHYLREQIAINHRTNNRNGEAIGLINLGYNYIQLGLYNEAQESLREAQKIAASIGALRENAYARLNLGLAYNRSGDRSKAVDVLESTIPELKQAGDLYGQASAHFYLALVREATGELNLAAENFEQAIDLFEQIGVQSYANDAQSGLARVKMMQDDIQEARKLVEEVCQYRQEHGPVGMEFPIWSYETCAEVFQAAGEKELASQLIDNGYQELMNRAEHISEEEWRKSFLENVPEHRSIIHLWQAKMSGQE